MSGIEGGGPSTPENPERSARAAIESLKSIQKYLEEVPATMQALAESDKPDPGQFIAIVTRFSEIEHELPELMETLTQARDDMSHKRDSTNGLAEKKVVGARVALLERYVLDIDQLEVDLAELWQNIYERATSIGSISAQDKLNLSGQLEGVLETGIKVLERRMQYLVQKLAKEGYVARFQIRIMRTFFDQLFSHCDLAWEFSRHAALEGLQKGDMKTYEAANKARDQNRAQLYKKIQDLETMAMNDRLLPIETPPSE